LHLAAPARPGVTLTATRGEVVGARAPIADGLFTWPAEEPRLIGGRCAACGTTTFPHQDGCPRCGAPGLEEQLLPRRGRLWAWTTQEFPPPTPPYAGSHGPDFEPFGVGYVELPGALRVEARLTEHRPERLRVGMEMELVIVPFGTDEEGTERVTFAFQPVEEGSRP
jgi:uncharacterized OB-fold protein